MKLQYFLVFETNISEGLQTTFALHCVRGRFKTDVAVVLALQTCNEPEKPRQEVDMHSVYSPQHRHVLRIVGAKRKRRLWRQSGDEIQLQFLK